jgi:hypothetical protein
LQRAASHSDLVLGLGKEAQRDSVELVLSRVPVPTRLNMTTTKRKTSDRE